MRILFNWTLPRISVPLGRRTAIMGILNVTPDSFSDGGMYTKKTKAVERALEMEAEGADLVDVGGESSRPGSAPISEAEELSRTLPVIEALAAKIRIPISIDTYRSSVARRALASGAQVVNDISACRFDNEMARILSDEKAGVVLMHSRGSRETLHQQPPMKNAIEEVRQDLASAVRAAVEAGVSRSAIVIDPGIGFGKRAEESLTVLSNLNALSPLECPVLVGPSRKSFLRRIVEVASDAPYGPLWGTAAAVAAAVLQGAHIVRVHDIREMRILVDTLDAVVEQRSLS